MRGGRGWDIVHAALGEGMRKRSWKVEEAKGQEGERKRMIRGGDGRGAGEDEKMRRLRTRRFAKGQRLESGGECCRYTGGASPLRSVKEHFSSAQVLSSSLSLLREGGAAGVDGGSAPQERCLSLSGARRRIRVGRHGVGVAGRAMARRIMAGHDMA